MYWIVSIVLVLTSIIAFLPKWERYRRQHSELFHFVMTIVATLTGVFVAIELSNSRSETEEKQYTVELMRKTVAEISEINKELELYGSMIEKEGKKSNVLALLFEQNELSYPVVIELMSSDPIILRNISISSLSNFLYGIRSINKLMDTHDKRFTVDAANDYIQEMAILEKVIDLEIKFLTKEISKQELEEGQKKVSKRKTTIRLNLVD